jgi:hypothetical protein
VPVGQLCIHVLAHMDHKVLAVVMKNGCDHKARSGLRLQVGEYGGV